MEKNSSVTSDLHGGAATRFFDLLSFAAVSAYLAGLLAFLAASGRLTPNLSVRGLLAASLLRTRRSRPLKRRRLRAPFPEIGHCYAVRLPWGLESDQEGRSRLLVYEDGRPLGPAHSLHETVRQQGRGAFSHWGRSLLYSASDNSDPRSNGRAYEIEEEP